jgi:hypothetical protein
MPSINESHRRDQPHVIQRCAIVMAVGACLSLFGCGDQSASGEYVGGSSTEVDRLQLVETPDWHLMGQLEISQLKPDGHIEYLNFAVTGAADGSNVSLSMKLPVPLTPAVDMSGTLAWNGITLTGGTLGGQSNTYTLRRGDDNQYQIALRALRTQAAQVSRDRAVAQAKAEAQAEQARQLAQERTVAQQINQLSDQMERIESTATENLQKFPAVASHYRDITSKMEEYLARERSLAGDQGAFSARSQLTLTINQGTIATYQLHDQVELVRDDFDGNATPMTKAAQTAKSDCENPNIQTDELKTACTRFLQIFPAYSKTYMDMIMGLADLEATYRSEEQKQRDLQMAAQHIN